MMKVKEDGHQGWCDHSSQPYTRQVKLHSTYNQIYLNKYGSAGCLKGG